MKVSIGILAWNEEEAIGFTLQSLLKQSLFGALSKSLLVEVICVPNGCADDTAGVATRVFEQFRSVEEFLDLRVENLNTPGKVNAWNIYVHDLSDPSADIVFLMDADINIRHPDTLMNMIKVVEQQDHVLAVTDEPIKHIRFKEKKSFCDRLSLAINSSNQAVPGQLTGQLYCVRGELIRQILMPRGLLAEDGFVKYMVATRLYTEKVDNSRMQRAESASHVFEGYTTLGDVFGHQRRQAVSNAILSQLLRNLKENCSASFDAGCYLRKRQNENPDWFIELMSQNFRHRFWVMPKGSLLARFTRLRHTKGRPKLRYLAVAAAVFPLDLWVNYCANNVLKSGSYAGIWQDTRTTGTGDLT
jgi:glycosyltransferase involved in cell wall biosynthesis